MCVLDNAIGNGEKCGIRLEGGSGRSSGTNLDLRVQFCQFKKKMRVSELSYVTAALPEPFCPIQGFKDRSIHGLTIQHGRDCIAGLLGDLT